MTSEAGAAQVYERFAELRALAREERQRRLAALRATDPGLAHELAGLLGADDTNAGFLETPALGASVDLSALAGEAALPRVLPERIGGYRILGLLGEGGMGVVYLAEQGTPRRTVALKVLRGECASPSRLRRFEHEAELLARLQHPGIAQVFEAGTAEVAGRRLPFIALEYVEGQDLRAYLRGLGPELPPRLALLIQVCQAVAHAHQKGVVHRDLKPENVRVDGAGRAKVLDFGVGRIVSAGSGLASLHTREGMLLGTPGYMSPEQLAGDPEAADTRSDVHALGMLAHEILVGRTPFALADKPLAEVARILRDDEPEPLWSGAGLRGPADLGTVVAKCLEKDPARRYPSAGELALDLVRVRENEPIAAQPPSGAYLLRKFVRRNRGLAAGAALALVALACGTVVLASQGVRLARERNLKERALVDVERERDRAQQALAEKSRERDKFEAGFRFLDGMLRSVDPAREGHEVRVADVLARGSQTLAGTFAGHPELEAELRRALGASWRALGRPEEALAEMRAGLELLERAPQTGAELDVARTEVALALKDLGRFEEAQALYAAALEHQRATLGPRALDTLVTLNNLAQLHAQRGEHALAEEGFREVIAGEIELGRSAAPSDTVVASETRDRLLLTARRALAETLKERGVLDEARALLETALNDVQRRFGERDPDTLSTLAALGTHAAAAGYLTRAIAYLEQSLAGFSEQLPGGHPTLLGLLSNLGTLYRRAGRAQEGEPLLRRAWQGRREVLGPEHLSTLTSENNLGGLLIELGRYDEAEVLLREALAGLERVLPEGHWMRAATSATLGECLLRTGRLAEAEERLERSQAELAAALGPEAEKTRGVRALLAEVRSRAAGQAGSSDE
jgi:tetratricopeptide (TPR) repeat protein